MLRRPGISHPNTAHHQADQKAMNGRDGQHVDAAQHVVRLDPGTDDVARTRICETL